MRRGSVPPIRASLLAPRATGAKLWPMTIDEKRPRVVGGGTKKLLYAADTILRMGVGKSAKALTARNTCKACAYGMGGQMGGMTNELGEFPSVCNKSVQAQSTDIQPGIAHDTFDHTIEELSRLSGRQMEKLGRLNTPLYKGPRSDRWRPVSWDWAIGHAAAQLKPLD